MRYLLMGTLLLADVAMTRPYPPVSDADIFYSITGVNMPDDYLMGADETAYSYPPLDPYPSLPSAAPTVAPLPPPLPPPSPPPPADVVRQPTWATQPQVYPALATYPQTAHLQPAYQQQPAYSIPSGFQMTPAVPGQTATLFVFVQGMPQQSYPGALVYPGQSQLVPVPVQLTPAESMEEEEEHWWSGFSWPTSDTVNKYWPGKLYISLSVALLISLSVAPLVDYPVR